MAIKLGRVSFSISIAEGGYILERSYYSNDPAFRELEDTLQKRIVCGSKQTLQDELLKAIKEVEELAR